MKRNIWKAPLCSYYFMQCPDEPTVVTVVTPPSEPADDFKEVIAEIRATVNALDDRLDTATSEQKQWITTQLQSITEKLTTLEANSRNSVEGLAAQIAEIKSQVADMLTRPLPEPPQEPALVIVEPPEQPEPPSGDGDGHPAPRTPAANPKPKKRVV